MGFIAKRFEADPAVLQNNLRHWFLFDNLDAVTGISLLLGLNPEYDTFEICACFGENQNNDEATLRFGVSLINGDEITINYPTSDDDEVSDFDVLDNEMRYFYYEEARDRFRPFANKFKRYLDYWQSGKHPDFTPLGYFVEWARSKGIAPSWDAVAVDLGLVAAVVTKQSTFPIPATTDRAHVSDKLAILNQAAQKWWSNANPNDKTTHVKNEDVIAWLIARGYSQTLASSAASIIRPEWANTGRPLEK